MTPRSHALLARIGLALRGAGAALAVRAALSLCGAATTAVPGSPPNILLVLADNWRWPNAGVLGDALARTPAFDRVAREGVLFTHTFNPVPSCSPMRACLLTGRVAHQLGERASLWSGFPRDTPVFTELLRAAGYDIGYSGKPWAPGNVEVSGWKENPAGPKYSSFETFHERRTAGRPFFFWLGNTDTATKAGRLQFLARARAVMRDADVRIPPELPDATETREDILNYYGGIMALDETVAKALRTLEAAGELENTVIVYMSDNGWQLPRGLGNCYDAGSRVPLAIRWGAGMQGGRCIDAFVNNAEIGPTLLDLAGLPIPAEMTLSSLKPLLLGTPDRAPRDAVFIERERHANVRRGNLSYPMRAVRTREFLYIQNLRADRWPAGDPDVFFVHGRPYGDVDTTRTKDLLLTHLQDPAFARFVTLIFARRPAEELYDLTKDPDQILNVAGQPQYASTQKALRARLERWRKETKDPRVDPTCDDWDKHPYYGAAPKIE